MFTYPVRRVLVLPAAEDDLDTAQQVHALAVVILLDALHEHQTVTLIAQESLQNNQHT